MKLYEKLHNSVFEMFLIVALASLAGIAYNEFGGNTIKYLYEPPARLNDSAVFGDKSKALSGESDADKKTTVSYEQMLKILEDDSFVIIDARKPEDYAAGCIGSAINIYPFEDDQEAYKEKIFMLDPEAKYLLYCDGGACDLSDHVYDDMTELGIEKIFLYKPGWAEWAEKKGLN